MEGAGGGRASGAPRALPYSARSRRGSRATRDTAGTATPTRCRSPLQSRSRRSTQMGRHCRAKRTKTDSGPPGARTPAPRFLKGTNQTDSQEASFACGTGKQVGERNEFRVEECYSWEGDASARRSAVPRGTAGRRCEERARDVLDGAEVRCPRCLSSNCENHI